METAGMPPRAILTPPCGSSRWSHFCWENVVIRVVFRAPSMAGLDTVVRHDCAIKLALQRR